MELICFEVEPGRVELRPAGTSRQWMDESPGGFAYRCLPLTMANSHGWEILCPADFEISWNGGNGIDDLQIQSHPPMSVPPQAYLAYLLGEKSRGENVDSRNTAPANMIESHFGSGILTFNPLVILRTAPGYNLWVTGPINQFKDAIQPMSALIESDWMPFTFSMNWKMTRPNSTVQFRKGEPFCAFFPVKRGVVDEAEPELRALNDDPELARAYWAARVERNVSSSTGADDKARFQSWYARGVVPGEADKTRETPPRASGPKIFK